MRSNDGQRRVKNHLPNMIRRSDKRTSILGYLFPRPRQPNIRNRASRIKPIPAVESDREEKNSSFKRSDDAPGPAAANCFPLSFAARCGGQWSAPVEMSLSHSTIILTRNEFMRAFMALRNGTKAERNANSQKVNLEKGTKRRETSMNAAHSGRLMFPIRPSRRP